MVLETRALATRRLEQRDFMTGGGGVLLLLSKEREKESPASPAHLHISVEGARGAASRAGNKKGERGRKEGGGQKESGGEEEGKRERGATLERVWALTWGGHKSWTAMSLPTPAQQQGQEEGGI